MYISRAVWSLQNLKSCLRADGARPSVTDSGDFLSQLYRAGAPFEIIYSTLKRFNAMARPVAQWVEFTDAQYYGYGYWVYDEATPGYNGKMPFFVGQATCFNDGDWSIIV